MMKLYQKSEITFAILWIVIYTVGMGTLQNNFGLDSLWHMLGLIVISAVIFLFVKKNGLMEKYGLAGWAKIPADGSMVVRNPTLQEPDEKAKTKSKKGSEL